jgi:hypothetical protein
MKVMMVGGVAGGMLARVIGKACVANFGIGAR